jgi:curved DNA-binding protein CbpA
MFSEYKDLETDEDFLDDLSETLRKVKSVCLSADETRAKTLSRELQDLVHIMEVQREVETAMFLKVLIRLLAHDESDDSLRLRGPYKSALALLLNELEDSKWRIGSQANDRSSRRVHVEGWQDSMSAVGSDRKAVDGDEKLRSSDSVSSNFGSGGWRSQLAAGDLYSILGVPSSASKPNIKAAFRRRALETHPVPASCF